MDKVKEAIQREKKLRGKFLKTLKRARKLMEKLPEEQRKGLQVLFGTPEEIDNVIREIEAEGKLE